MALNTLVLTAVVDGFQHGEEAFTPKTLSLVSHWMTNSYAWSFETSELTTKSLAHLRTYKHQSDNVHGVPLQAPGLPKRLFPVVLRHTIDDVLLECWSETGHCPAEVVIFTKNSQQVKVLEDALKIDHLQVPVVVRDLDMYNCPPIAQLCSSLPAGIPTTRQKAQEYARWLAQNGFS